MKAHLASRPIQALATLAAIALLGLAFVYGISEWKLRRAWDAPLSPLNPPRPPDPAAGEHMARVVGCWAGCHGADFRGHALEGGPPLAIVAAYDADQFRNLLRTGRPPDGREIPKMDWMADVDFTEQEISDLYAFLRELHGLPEGG
jgi:hypothetical protein